MTWKPEWGCPHHDGQPFEGCPRCAEIKTLPDPPEGLGRCEACGEPLADCGPIGVECITRGCLPPWAERSRRSLFRAFERRDGVRRLLDGPATPDPKTFSIDFDGTFTVDPELFRALVVLLQRRGHRVILTSQRCRQFLPEIEEALGNVRLPIVFASGLSKEAAAREFGYDVDVWMDDSPFSVSTALVYRGCPDGPPELVTPEEELDG